MADNLDALHDSLLRGRPQPLASDQGQEAFERHQLLAIRFHRAAKVNNGGAAGDRAEWRQYFDQHFPRGGEHGKLLFERWRTTLLKERLPEPAWRLHVAIRMRTGR